MLGGRSFNEEQGWLARARLEKASEKHTIVKGPCCGTGVEITDPTRDNYVVCPNPQCRKRYVVLSGLKHEVVMEGHQGGNLLDYNF